MPASELSINLHPMNKNRIFCNIPWPDRKGRTACQRACRVNTQCGSSLPFLSGMPGPRGCNWDARQITRIVVKLSAFAQIGTCGCMASVWKCGIEPWTGLIEWVRLDPLSHRPQVGLDCHTRGYPPQCQVKSWLCRPSMPMRMTIRSGAMASCVSFCFITNQISP